MSADGCRLVPPSDGEYLDMVSRFTVRVSHPDGNGGECAEAMVVSVLAAGSAMTCMTMAMPATESIMKPNVTGLPTPITVAPVSTQTM
jgi:hypothetical protein